MTAKKETTQTAKEIARGFWMWEDTSDTDIIESITWGQLKQFAAQLCKEQREICASKASLKLGQSTKFDTWEINKDLIKNAPMPEI